MCVCEYIHYVYRSSIETPLILSVLRLSYQIFLSSEVLYIRTQSRIVGWMTLQCHTHTDRHKQDHNSEIHRLTKDKYSN